MRLMHCTSKLISDLNVFVQPKDEHHINIGLGDWYSNIFDFNRRYCLIFTNSKTLLTFVVPGLQKKDLKGFHGYFIKGLTNLLNNSGINKQIQDKIIPEYINLQVVKTESKSVIGSMNDFVLHYKAAFDKSNDYKRTIDDFNVSVNTIPMGGLNMDTPTARLRKLIDEEYN